MGTLARDTEAVQGFWQAAAAADDEWYRLHPVIAGTAAELCIPVGLHGDDAGVHGNEQVLVISWNGVTFHRPTLDSRIVFTMMKVAQIIPETMQRVYEVLKWSFDALATGRFPAADPWEKVFCEDYMPERARNAGRPLAERADGQYYRGAFAEFRGDWKYLKEAFCFTEGYHKDDFICHRCMARKQGISPGMWYSIFCRNAEHRTSMVSNREFVEAYSRRSPLVNIPGMHITRIVFDLMHCMELGVLQLLIPSLLSVLVSRRSRRYPGRLLDERYQSAYIRYRRWCYSERKVLTNKKRYIHKHRHTHTHTHKDTHTHTHKDTHPHTHNNRKVQSLVKKKFCSKVWGPVLVDILE